MVVIKFSFVNKNEVVSLSLHIRENVRRTSYVFESLYSTGNRFVTLDNYFVILLLLIIRYVPNNSQFNR